MNFIDLPAGKTARGVVRLPGSKSISNRVLLLAALADGVTEIRDLLLSDDTARMLEALASLRCNHRSGRQGSLSRARRGWAVSPAFPG